MPIAEKRTTILSTKGQVVLPASVRGRKRWKAGTRLVVEETAEGVLLKPASAFSRTKMEDVFGCLPYTGQAKTVEEMDASIVREVKRRHARARY